MWPTSVAMPVLTTRIVPAPRVTCVFMKARSTRSPRPASRRRRRPAWGPGRSRRSGPTRRSRGWPRVRIRPSAGTRSPASMLTMSPGHELVHRQLDEGAVATGLGRHHHHLLERGDARVRLALLVEAHRGVEQRQADEHDPGGDLAGEEQAEDARREQDDLHRVPVLAEERLPARLLGGSANLFGPYWARRESASACVSPRSGCTPCRSRAACGVRACQAGWTLVLVGSVGHVRLLPRVRRSV